MIIVSGNTFAIKDRLKNLGGLWNAEKRQWEIIALTPEQRSLLASNVGVIITDSTERVKPLSQYNRELLSVRLNDPHSPIFGDDRTWINYFSDQNPTAYFGFSSLAAMARYVEAIPSDMRRNAGWQEINLYTIDNWSGSRDMNEALELARDGWSDGIEMAREIVEQLTGRNAIERRRKHSIAGGSVNVGRLLAGNPVHMIARPKQPGRKIVTLFCEAFMSSSIDPDHAIIRAALAAAIVDILEINGYSCEIISIATARKINDAPAYQIATTLKQAGESLNLADVVYALGHPAYFRRMCFACVGSDNNCRPFWGSMGHPSAAFDKKHETKPGEFYIKQIPHAKRMIVDSSASLMTQAMQIWDLIIDKNLPITIKRENDE